MYVMLKNVKELVYLSGFINVIMSNFRYLIRVLNHTVYLSLSCIVSIKITRIVFYCDYYIVYYYTVSVFIVLHCIVLYSIV